MNNLALLIPIAAIVMGPLAWMVTTWTRARHGYPLDDKEGNLIGREGQLTVVRQAELLTAENERLKGQVGRLEERITVLERIATDPATRTAREIEALRQEN